MSASVSLAVATSLLLVGCAGDDVAAPASPTDGASPLGSLGRQADPITALCQAERLAAEGDAQGAGAAFVDGAHARIHELAAELQSSGRPAEAGRLLEAKQRVEAALRAAPESLPNLLAALRASFVEASEASGAPVAAVCA